MSKILLMCALLLAAIFVSAQQDTKAKSILDQVSQKTSSLKSFSADFAFTMQNMGMNINEKNTGSIQIKGQKYCVELPEVGMKVFSDGKTVWNYMKDGNQVTISNIDDESNELMNPSSLFSIYEKDFVSKFVAEKKLGSKTVYEIDLFPQSKDQDVSKVTVTINKENMMIHSAVLHGNDGNLYGIEVLKMETNREFPDSHFIFDKSKYKDLEVIDFR